MYNKLIVVADLNKIGKIAHMLSFHLKMGDCLALYGDLGAGKTTFTSFVVKSLGSDNNISSPTFTIMNEYSSNNLNIIHVDAYRINREDIGLEDLLNNSLVIIEWAENIESFLPKEHIKISFRYLNDIEREVILETVDGYKIDLFKELEKFLSSSISK